MNQLMPTLGKLAVETNIATASLLSSLCIGHPSRAGEEAVQEPAKVTVKTIETKTEVLVIPGQPAAKAEVKVEGVIIGVQKAVVATPAKEEVRKEAVKEVAKEAVKEVRPAQKAVAGRAIRVMPVQPAAPDAEAIRAAMIEQIRPMFRVEMRLLDAASQPTPAQRREIALVGGKALKEVAGKLGDLQQGMNRGAFNGNNIPEPRKVIHDAMQAAAKANLTPEQLERYKKEMDRRTKDQHEVVVVNVVANMDKILILSTDQRKKLCDSLLSHWDDKVYPTLDLLVTYEAYFPMIPESYINPVLNEEQKKIWRGAQKLQFATIRNFNFFNNGMANQAVEEVQDEDEKAALAVETKK
jgi:hypothetical protein